MTKKIDKILLTCSIVYIILPILIFFIGWLKIPLAIIFNILFIFFAIKLYQELSKDQFVFSFNRKYIKFLFWFSLIAVCIIWVYLSGIGGFVYQNEDFWARNPIFTDLCNKKWPVIFDLSKERLNVQNMIGSDKVAFSYYFTWWLPVAALSKIFHLNDFLQNLSLYIYACIGIFLLFYLIMRYFKKLSFKIPIIFIMFSGLDILGYLIIDNSFTITTHMEWWAKCFQYSSNTTMLFWVFNQAIPIWIITILMLQLKNSKYIFSIMALSFAYSPWATIGLLPYGIYELIKQRKDFKNIINVANVSVVSIMAFIYGTFYIANSNNSGTSNTLLVQENNIMKFIFLILYFVFILFEFLIYFRILKRIKTKLPYYYIAFAELLILPLITIHDENFTMRASIPALFLLTIYIMIYFINTDKKLKKRSATICLIIFLIIGCATPLTEISRAILVKNPDGTIRQDKVGSFGQIKTDDEIIISKIKQQFFVYEYKDKFFFKYLSK